MKGIIRGAADKVVFAAGFVLYMIAVAVFSKLFSDEE